MERNFNGMEKIKEILKIAKVADEPVLLVGKHGIGKTETVAEFAAENNCYFQPLYLSHQETADLIGIPMEKDGATIWSKPEWLVEIEKASKNQDIVLFLDELNRAALDVRQVALQLVLNKEVHTHKLPNNTYIVAAINPTDDEINNYQAEELDRALLDRFFVINVESNTEDWLKWAGQNGVHPIITKFISKFPEYLYYEDENLDVFPTNRGWVKLSNVLKSFEKMYGTNNKANTILVDFINGKIGPIVGQKFLNFYQNEKTFNIEDLLRHSYNIEEKIGNKKVSNVYNKLVEFNDFDSDLTFEDIQNDKNINEYFEYIKNNAAKLTKDYNIETAEVYYNFEKLLDMYKKDPRKYYVPMTLLLHIAKKEVLVSIIKQLGTDVDTKTLISYTIPFLVEEIFQIIEGK